jgi:hypothetical protein
VPAAAAARLSANGHQTAVTASDVAGPRASTILSEHLPRKDEPAREDSVDAPGQPGAPHAYGPHDRIRVFARRSSGYHRLGVTRSRRSPPDDRNAS